MRMRLYLNVLFYPLLSHLWHTLKFKIYQIIDGRL